MRRAVAILLLSALLAALLGGCGGAPAQPEDGGKLSVVATIFPVWDWTRNVIGETDGVQLSLLLDSGVDMHSFQPGVDDIAAISACDLLIYVGGESDDWIADALAESVNPSQRALNLLDVLGDSVYAEELTEGMIGEADGAADEHIWLSPRMAETLTDAIAEALCELDPGHAEAYRANAAAYGDALAELEADYAALAADIAAKDPAPCLLVADRFPFRYLTEELGLDYCAAFSGCSAETGASFETVTFLAGKIDALGLDAIFTTESPVPGMAETVVRSAQRPGVQTLVLDSLQSVTAADAENGVTYVGVMERNLEILIILANS